MAITLLAGWDFARLGTHAATFTDFGGAAIISYSSGLYAHESMGSVLAYSKFATTLAADLNANATLGASYGVTYAPETNKYTISSNGNFTITQGGAAAGDYTRFKALLGLTGDVASTLSKTSDCACYYGLLSTAEGLTNDSELYEPDSGIEESEADDGTHYSISRSTFPDYRNFELWYQAKAITHAASAGAQTTPWTFDHFVSYCRAANPFIQWDTAGAITKSVHYLLADGATFRPKRHISNNDIYWDWPLKTRQKGTL